MFIDKIKKRIKSAFVKEVKNSCPFCGHSLNDMGIMGVDSDVLRERNVVGAGKRPCLCLACGSSDRERLVYIFLKEKTGIFKCKERSILHIAPEKNLSTKLLEVGFDNYVCGDLFAEGYVYPEHVKNMNILKLPYEDNTFDFVICNHVLEHIADDLEAMKELRRVLRVGGMAIL